MASDTNLADEVAAMFTAHREHMDAAYDADRFLDFLTDPGISKRGTAHWNRRFFRFIEAVQMEFGVCFSQADLDRNFSLAQFAERISYLQDHPKGSLQSLKNQQRHSDITIWILANLILFGVGSFFWDGTFGRIILIIIAVLMNGGFVLLHMKQKRYLKSLEQKITGA